MSAAQDRGNGRDPDTIKAMLRYLDGVASADEVAQLATRLRANPSDRRELARLLLQMGALEDLAKTPALTRAPVSRSRSHRLTWIAAGAAAVAALGVFAVVRTPQRRVGPVEPAAPVTVAGPRPRRAPHLVPPPNFGDRPVARVESMAGTAFATGEGRRHGLQVGAPLVGGDGLETVGGPDARVALALADGARLELRGDGHVAGLSAEHEPGHEQPRVSVSLERGTAIFSVPTRPEGPMSRLVTSLADVRVRTGQVHVAIEPEVTKVRLRWGAAEVRRLSDDQRLALEPGQSVVISETRALAVEGPRALLVRGSDARGEELDRLITARLEADGFAVRGVEEAALTAGDFADQALVVISSSSAGGALAARLPATGLRELAVPVINCESFAFIPLGMASRQGVGPDNTQLLIEQPAHALAAGKVGEVRIASGPVGATWGLPTSSAVRLATLTGRRRVALFSYERGAQMIGLPAPARRVSCFLDTRRAGLLTEEAWQLFDATVRWAVAP